MRPLTLTTYKHLFTTKPFPKCCNCVHYRFDGISKSYDLGYCVKFGGTLSNRMYVEIARNNDYMCGLNGLHFVKSVKNDKETNETKKGRS